MNPMKYLTLILALTLAGCPGARGCAAALGGVSRGMANQRAASKQRQRDRDHAELLRLARQAESRAMWE